MKKSVLIFISILICSCTNISKIDGLLDEVEVLRDNSKLDPEVKSYLEEENTYAEHHLKDTKTLQKKTTD